MVKLERTIQLHERTSPTHSQGHIVAWGGVTSHRLQTRKPTESAELWVKYPEHVHAFTHTHTLFRYDFAHCISDAIEGITHSLCTLEFEDHRPLYDWFVNEAPVSPSVTHI